MPSRGAPGRRTRRLLIILASVGALGLVAATAYAVRQSQLDDQALRSRDAGRAAVARGDWAEGVDGLKKYLDRYSRRGPTAADYVLYARARRHLESSNGAHLLESIQALRHALDVDPACAAAQKDLLDLYLRTGYATEASDLVDVMLRSQPSDAGLLHTKCDLLEGQRKLAPALAVAKRLNDLEPGDIDGWFQTLRLLLAVETSAEEVDEWLGWVLQSHAGDERFELLRAAVLGLRHDEAAARRSIERALSAAAGSDDPKFIALVIPQLDAASRFEDSMKLLESKASERDPALVRELVRRLWYAGRAQDVVAAVRRFTDPALQSDPEMLALLAMALDATGDADGAAKVRADLAARKDPASAAWSTLVARQSGDGLRAPGAVADLLAASNAVASSGIIRAALGDAYAALGESDLAMDAWKSACVSARCWAGPLRRIAESLLAGNQEYLAPIVAREAMVRSPNELASIATYLKATMAVAGELNPQQVESLLALVRKFEEAAPEQADEMLSFHVGLLARVGREPAEQRLREILRASGKPSEASLLRLAQVAAQSGTTLEPEFLDLSEKLHGVTPQLALARAVARARSGDAEAGLRVMDELRSRAGGAQPVEWGLVRASFIDAVRRADAAQTWIALADAYAGELRPQLGALASTATWTDRGAVDRIIERVRALTGEQGVTWRIARARWLLDSPRATEEQVAEAARFLSDVAAAAPRSLVAHVFLAQALERLGNVSGAEDHLQIAQQLAPENGWVSLELARLAQRQDRLDVARRHIERVLAGHEVMPQQVERAAFLLATQGDLRRSADLLQPLMSGTDARREGMLLLARLYSRLGEYERALSICERLSRSADPEVIAMTAELYAALGRRVDADVALRRLDSVAARPGERELLRARYAASWGTPESARDWYQRAVAAAPDRADAWIARLTHAIAAGDRATVAAVLDDRRADVAEPVQYMAGIRAVLDAALPDVRLRALLVDAVDSKQSRAALLQGMELVLRGGRSAGERLATARNVADLAEANFGVLPLHLVAADLCSEAGLHRRSCELARRAMTGFPNSRAAAAQAVASFGRAGRRQDALDAALRWRERCGGRSRAADALVADGQLRCGRPADAEATLAPHVAGASAKADGNDGLVVLDAVALVRNGKPELATPLLADLVGRGDPARRVVLTIDPALLGDAASARAWFQMLEAALPASDAGVRLALARAWVAASEAFGDAALRDRARAVVGRITQEADAPAEALSLAAALDQQAGDVIAARRNYEAALARDPTSVFALNNLAGLLADSGSGAEAVALARKAVAAAPLSGECLDTLAHAHRKSGNLPEAVRALRSAIELDPVNLGWRVALAELLAEQGDAAALDAAVIAADELVSAGVERPEALRSRLDAVRPVPR